ncbi:MULTISPECIES: DUF2147 domain-containing protein [unclassified Herbaspirillum]|uniref:DUF2147 domain-containing protein n=1 Tax=unclassified Herbaspirillum TaxID=2624150 RepID=UPI001154C06D|nr:MULTISPECIES: DUF2147 domain-containing protein [unclassified Herbaspirillum]MBB5392600.1 uncharacterized protein (DUF2147 family) [Herbaspirillum sp. SJZ102]TQK06237.1 uncharacterized protein (DUF2147 family) [Herbaspirillum sp. SJZ130]TQK12285.1 uncharacterized protein (DUF2147 family) [Herbaspirillum sp. SJZ106]TWC68440.1 uncharacterized protein (DUF2147 family) [Herbaspirillum sp. SJZ099]
MNTKASPSALPRLAAAGVLLAGLLASACAFADGSPVGLWKNIDDATGKPKALIRITESNGELSGKIEKLFRAPEEDQNPVCEKCEGELKGKPIVGMTILSGLKKDGDEYNGGQILDPANGKLYKSKLTVVEDGKKLNVRGYIGMPMLGRTQTWVREE